MASAVRDYVVREYSEEEAAKMSGRVVHWVSFPGAIERRTSMHVTVTMNGLYLSAQVVRELLRMVDVSAGGRLALAIEYCPDDHIMRLRVADNGPIKLHTPCVGNRALVKWLSQHGVTLGKYQADIRPSERAVYVDVSKKLG